ncbi:hypothetical protein ACNKHX_10975 [Shigella flexneri]
MPSISCSISTKRLNVIVSDAAAITPPHATSDIQAMTMWCIAKPQIDFYQRLRSPLQDLHLLPGLSTTRWVKRTGRWHLKKCKALVEIYMLTNRKNLIINMKTAQDHQRIDGGYLLVTHDISRLIPRIALCVWR